MWGKIKAWRAARAEARVRRLTARLEALNARKGRGEVGSRAYIVARLKIERARQRAIDEAARAKATTADGGGAR